MPKTKAAILFSMVIAGSVLLMACRQPSARPEVKPLFEVIESEFTGLHFTNNLTPTADFNMFNYMYFYNGAGVGAGDFNNDGLIDLFFAGNQTQDKLYLNKGDLIFADVTDQAGIPQDGGWSTGVSVADVNSDGLLDIYISRVGNYETLRGENLLLICTEVDSSGIPIFHEKAAEFGLGFSGFSTQAAFFDYDLDGDLDMYLMNHSVRNNGTFGRRESFLNTYDELAGDRLYRNDNNHFTDVTRESGINSSAIGYGLGITVSDLNLDGWPDLYIGNDFHENDYLYINQKNGTFKDELTNCMMHTSQFSMGVDAADINNDAYPDIISMDMLPSDPYILKRSLGEDEYNLFNMKVNYGYIPQYARNNLQLHTGNDCYTETGRYSGIYATDWSWSALWMDFDNDGLKDLFVSNGIPKRLNDMDYVNYISNDEVQLKIKNKTLSSQDMALIDRFPEIKLPNKFFKNTGDAVFEDIGPSIKGDRPTFSNGAVYADFDNDGDLDIVVNNIADEVLLYKNTLNDAASSTYLRISLKGPQKNLDAVGAKLIVYSPKGVETYEKQPARGFMSSMEIPFNIGLQHVRPDSIKLVWPDNTWEAIAAEASDKNITVAYRNGLPHFDYTELKNTSIASLKTARDIAMQTGLLYKHTENNFVEFDREPLMPHMASQEGPALAVGDIDGDGLDDVYVGASRGFKGSIFLQGLNGKFTHSPQPVIDLDSNYEDVSACITDVNNDGHSDLVVASGGNEYFGHNENNSPRVYINDRRGRLQRLAGAFDNLYLTASCIVPYDFNSDGYTDLFVGARAVSFDYGKKPTSYLLQNDGKGRFKDVTNAYSKDLSNAGFVTHAVWQDMDNDGDKDLLIACEWDGLYVYLNNKTHFTKKLLTGKKGWWNFVLPVDVDNDGDLDLVAGNLGLNSRLVASEKQPVSMYYADFDGNGKKEQLFTYYLNDREIPFANKGEIEKQLPLMKKQFLYAEDFAKASLNTLFSKEKLENADALSADYFSNAILLNDGKLNFTLSPLPWQAQLSCFKDAVVIDANNDNLPDILMAGNFYANNIQMGRYDGDYGTILLNRGKGSFSYESLNGVVMKGQVRHLRQIKINQKNAIVFAKNNDSLKVISLE